MAAEGTVELRWRDRRGSHFEQADLDLSLVLPDRVSLAVSKFGERILWFGSAGSREWLFDWSGDQSVLFCGRGGAGLPPEAPALPVEPQDLLAMAGLVRLPEPAPVEGGGVSYDRDHDAWAVGLGGRDLPMKLFLDRRLGLPVRVEALDSNDGRLLAWSRIYLDRYDRVSRTGAVAGPAGFPTLVDIVAAEGDGSIKISVHEPGDLVRDRLFDLDWLIGALEPDRIDGSCVVGTP